MATDEIIVDNLRQLLHIQTELREQAETRWRKAQRALVELLEVFAPEEVDQRLKTGRPMDNLAVEELEQLIRQTVGSRLSQAQMLLKESRSVNVHQDLQGQTTKLQGDLKQANVENLRLTNRIGLLEAENSGLLSQLAALQQVTPSAREPGEKLANNENLTADHSAASPPEPEWMAGWRQSETFERDASILKIIGETGLARRPQIDAQSAELLGIKKAGGSIQALMLRLVGLKLVEIFRPWDADGSGTGGRFPDLVRLTDQGQLAFWLLTGNQAKVNEYDQLLERHESPEHTLLNMQAADLLREAGYQVNLYPPEIKLPDKGLFKPDLILTEENGRTIFVEVEREMDKNIEKRQSKWRNFYQASGGRLYVVCENRSSMKNIRSEINYCLGNQPTTISLTNLAELQAGKRGDGDSIWLETKQKGG